MTSPESQALQIMGDMVKEIARSNAQEHDEIKVLIKDLERRLCVKIEQRDKEIKALMTHCQERSEQVDNAIAAAKQAAIQEATAPGIYAQATAGLGRFALRVLTVLGAMTAVAGGVLGILKAAGVL